MNPKRTMIIIVLLIIVGIAAYSMGIIGPKGGSNMIVAEELKEAADFTLSDLLGNEITLSSLKGKVVFLNFWATWCPPCRSEMPSMQSLHEKMKGKDFVMLAVDVGERKEGVRSFIDKNDYTFTVLLDSNHEVSIEYKIAGIPTTLLLNKEGKIVFRETGSRNWATPDVTARIENLLK